MNEENPVAAHFARARIGMNVEIEKLLEKAACPEIVVAADEMEFDAPVAKVRKGPQNFKIVRKNDMSILEPEVEEIAQDDNPVEFGGIDPPARVRFN